MKLIGKFQNLARVENVQNNFFVPPMFLANTGN